MKFLRVFLILYAIAYLIGGVVLVWQKYSIGNIFVALYLIINAVLIIVGTLFERKRYFNNNDTSQKWKKTRERFVDSASGKLMEVYFNPKTGERDYREVKS